MHFWLKGPYYDLELTEKEIERIVMEASREEYLEYLNQQQVNFRIIKGQGQSHLLLPQVSTILFPLKEICN